MSPIVEPIVLIARSAAYTVAYRYTYPIQVYLRHLYHDGN